MPDEHDARDASERFDDLTELQAPDAATVEERRAIAQRWAEVQRGGLPDAERAAGEARLMAADRQRMAGVGWGGMSDADRAAAERANGYQPGSISARLDGNVPEHEVDTPEEVGKFTTAGQDSPEAAVTKGSPGEAQHQDRVRWPERDPDREID
jgi:hypothetical protein